MEHHDDGLVSAGDALGIPLDRWRQLDVATRTGEWRTGLADVAAIRRALHDIEGRLVRHAREEGASWADVGEAIGLTKQAAFYRYRNHA